MIIKVQILEVPYILYYKVNDVTKQGIGYYYTIAIIDFILFIESIITVVFFSVTIRLMKKEEYSQIEVLNNTIRTFDDSPQN